MTEPAGSAAGGVADMEAADGTSAVAERVVLSYPADLSAHARQRIEKDYYRKYLRKVHTTATVGDAWDEFTDVGCCGSQTDVPLRVERVEGGRAVGPDTAIDYEERTACGLDRGWAAQNDEPDTA